MRRLALIVVLLVPLAGAVDERDPGLSPVQTVIDAVPGIVADAIREAGRDGTPDAADAEALALERFATGLHGSFLIPGGSAADRAGLEAALPFALQVAQLTTAVPADIGQVERDVSACTEWGASKGVAAGRGWIEGGRRATSGVIAYRAAFEQLASEAPAGVDGRPLRSAADALAKFADTRGLTGQQCFEELSEALNITVALPDLWIRLIPSASWPGGQIVAIGASPETSVTIAAPGIITQKTLTAEPNFVTSLRVLTAAPLGQSIVTASAGSQQAEAPLDLDRAPSFIRLTAPDAVNLGDAFQARAAIVSDLTPVGAVAWRGAEGTPIHQGIATQRFTATTPGPMTVSVTYAGNERIQPSSASIIVTVIDDSIAASELAAPKDPWFEPQNASPWWLLLAVAIVAIVVAARTVRPRVLAASLPEAPTDAEAAPPSGFIAGVAGFMHWLIRLGRAQPGTTVREAAREHPEMRAFVSTFERARYAEIAPPAGSREKTATLLERIMIRLRGKS